MIQYMKMSESVNMIFSTSWYILCEIGKHFSNLALTGLVIALVNGEEHPCIKYWIYHPKLKYWYLIEIPNSL